MPSGEGYDLHGLRLSDKLNLTGRVKRQGVHAAISGGCANVWEGEFEGEKVAVKVIREVGTRASKERLQKRLVREVRAWSKLHHRNVLNLLGFAYGFDASSTLASLVSPWMPKGTSTRYLENRNAAERIRVLTGVADGLCYLHRHDVVHGDLKGDNILIDMRGEPRLADFGLSKLMTDVQGEMAPEIHTLTDALPGSVRWMARELFEAKITPSVSCESDIWAFGMTTLEFFTSLPPYHHLRNDAQVIIHVHNGVLPERPDKSTGLDDALWDLCLDCWHRNPLLRPTTRVIAKRLWEFDLQCKLRVRTKRRSREPDSPDSDHGRLASCEERLRKSPKLSTLAELSAEESPSPGSPLSSSRALMRTPTPRSASMSTSSGSRFSDSSRSNSSSDFSDVDPRRFFTNSQSESNLYSHLHSYNERLRTVERGYSDSALPSSSSAPPQMHRGHRPSGLGLEVTAYADRGQFDPSTALVPPRHIYADEGSPRQLTHPLPPLDVHHHHYQQPALHRYPHLPDGAVSSDAFLYYEQFPHNPYDPMHPSQWQSFFPATCTNNSSAYQLHSTGAYSELAMVDGEGGRTPSSFADFLTLPAQDAYTSYPLGHSPQDSVILSPHEIGPIFSDAFISEPLSYDDLGSSNSSRPRIDFESFRQGIISPALSEATPTEFLRQVLDPDGLANPAESPLIQDYSSFDSFEDEEVGSELSLFGGLGVAEGDFESDASLFANTDVHSSATPTERTPRNSPRGIANLIPAAPHSPERPTRMPPTPRLSPLLSSF